MNDDSLSIIQIGPWINLPQEIVDKILLYLGDIDMIGYIYMTSKSVFHPTDEVFKFLCEITYLKQTSKKLLQVKRWNSWKNMLIHRPRLRTNGFYTLRTLFSKAPCNDAFWEERRVQSIEVRFYRHFRFFDDGRVIYSLDIIDPDGIKKLFAQGITVPKRIYEGRYILSGRDLKIIIPVHYCIMHFDLILLDGDDGYQGKHNMLTLIRHASSSLRTPMIINCEYSLPINCNFRYHRVWDFSSRQTQQQNILQVGKLPTSLIMKHIVPDDSHRICQKRRR